jgi:hypothetical protein
MFSLVRTASEAAKKSVRKDNYVLTLIPRMMKRMSAEFTRASKIQNRVDDLKNTKFAQNRQDGRLM